jgi:hypothetical protein
MLLYLFDCLPCTLAMNLKVVSQGGLVILELVHLDFTEDFLINLLGQLSKEYFFLIARNVQTQLPCLLHFTNLAIFDEE